MRSNRSFALAVAVAAAIFAASGPAGAVERSCTALYEVRPTNFEGTSVWHEFRGHAASTDPDSARRYALDHIFACIRDHWFGDARGAGQPASCGPPKVLDYPFDVIGHDITAEICAANPGQSTILVSVILHFNDTGACMPGDNLYQMELEPNGRITCPTPRTTIEPMPRLEPVDPNTPAPVSLMPGVRLPGNDIGAHWLGRTGTWQDCARICAETDGCRAWTWRRPGTNPARPDEARCLLKSRVLVVAKDPCCTSGLRE